MNREPNGNGNSQGMILVVVLWATAMMTVIVVALSAFAQKSGSLAGLEADRLRTQMALEAAIDVGKAMILSRPPNARVFFDGAPATVDIGDRRMVSVAIMDAAGLVDINRADGELLQGLAARLDPSGGNLADLVEKIVQLREAGKPKAAVNQAPLQNQEAASGDGTTQPVQAQFVSTLQLFGLEGAEPEAVNKLLPLVTLYSVDGKVNPMAAPDLVIQSIPGLKLAEAETLAAARKRGQFDNPAVQNVLAQYSKFLAVREAKIFMISATAVAGRGMIAGSRSQAVVILNDTANQPFRVLAWSW
jgi:general secretion pathway protein K